MVLGGNMSPLSTKRVLEPEELNVMEVGRKRSITGPFLVIPRGSVAFILNNILSLYSSILTATKHY